MGAARLRQAYSPEKRSYFPPDSVKHSNYIGQAFFELSVSPRDRTYRICLIFQRYEIKVLISFLRTGVASLQQKDCQQTNTRGCRTRSEQYRTPLNLTPSVDEMAGSIYTSKEQRFTVFLSSKKPKSNPSCKALVIFASDSQSIPFKSRQPSRHWLILVLRDLPLVCNPDPYRSMVDGWFFYGSILPLLCGRAWTDFIGSNRWSRLLSPS